MTGVFVFIQEGCGACHEYMPRFQYAARPFAHRIPIGVYDIAKGGRAASFADSLGVRATPTTITLDRRGRLQKYEGALSNAQITHVLSTVARG